MDKISTIFSCSSPLRTEHSAQTASRFCLTRAACIDVVSEYPGHFVCWRRHVVARAACRWLEKNCSSGRSHLRRPMDDCTEHIAPNHRSARRCLQSSQAPELRGAETGAPRREGQTFSVAPLDTLRTESSLRPLQCEAGRASRALSQRLATRCHRLLSRPHRSERAFPHYLARCPRPCALVLSIAPCFPATPLVLQPSLPTFL